MPYNRINWKNGEAGNTPLNQTNLNHMEDGIKANEGDIAENKSAIDSAELAIDALQLRPTFAIVNTSKSPLKDSGSSNILAIDVLANSKQYISPNIIEGTDNWSGTWIAQSYWNNDGTYLGLTVKKGTANWNGLHKYFPAQSGKTYTISAYVKGSISGCQIESYLAGLDTVRIGAITIGTNWQRVSFSYTPTSSGSLAMRIESRNDSNLSICGYMITTDGSTEYQPYSTPTPATPVPIVDASGEILAHAKNLLNYSAFNRWAWEDHADGSKTITQNGIYCTYVINAEPGKYTFTGDFTGVNSGVCRVFVSKEYPQIGTQILRIENAGNGQSVTVPEGYHYIVAMYAMLAAPYEIRESEKMQIEKGESVSEYEPYKSISVYIGNMFNINKMLPGMVIDANNGSIVTGNARGTSDFIPLAEGETLSFSASADIDVNVHWYDAGKNWLNDLREWKFIKDGYDFTQKTGAAFIRFSFRTKTDDVITTEGTKNYGIVAVNNKKIPYILRSIGNIRDELVIEEGGAGKLIRRIGAKTYSELAEYTWRLSGSYPGGAYTYDSRLTNKVDGALLCPQLPYVKTLAEYGQRVSCFSDGSINLRFKTTNWGNVDEYITYLRGLSGSVYYELANPIVTELTREQVRQILALRTYSPETYIDSDLDVTITYAGDPKAYIDEKTGGGEVYSTEETLIGTWEGEKLYRRIMNFTAPRTSGTDNIYHFDPAENCNVKNFYGTIIDTNFALNPINFYKGNGRYSYLTFDASGTGNFYMEVGGAMTGAQCTLVVEYTKTEYNLAALNEGDDSQPAPLALTEGEE